MPELGFPPPPPEAPLPAGGLGAPLGVAGGPPDEAKSTEPRKAKMPTRATTATKAREPLADAARAAWRALRERLAKPLRFRAPGPRGLRTRTSKGASKTGWWKMPLRLKRPVGLVLLEMARWVLFSAPCRAAGRRAVTGKAKRETAKRVSRSPKIKFFLKRSEKCVPDAMIRAENR